MGSAIFECASVEDAMRIILTPEVGLSTEQRWERETAWLSERLDFQPGQLVVDYGCGIGRVSKVLTDSNCAVIGVDLSASMCRMAEDNVASPELFATMSPVYFDRAVGRGLRLDGALTVWCLQHIPMPALHDAIKTLYLALRPGSALWTMERPERLLPEHRDGRLIGWAKDGVSVAELLMRTHFILLDQEFVPEALCAPGAMLRKWRTT